MKRTRRPLSALLTFVLILSVFLLSAPVGRAQTSLDWSEPVNLSFSGAATNPIVTVDDRGFIHVIWLDAVDGYKYAQSRDGKTFSPAQTVKFPFGPKDPPPVLVPGKGGVIHVFWVSGSDQRLFYGQATAGDFPYPQNWVLVTRIQNSVASFDAMLDAQGVLHVAFIQNNLVDNKPAGVYYTQSPSGGGFWVEPRLLYASEYFRSALQSDLYIRLSTSNTATNQRVYVTWDNRAQKRVFMAVSRNNGAAWGEAQQIKGPEDTGGFETPFNLTVSAYGQNVLLIWQVGEPGSSKCTVFSQFSRDGGQKWEDPVAVLGGRTECPVATKSVERNTRFMTVLFVGQVSPFMVAWNGSQWSDVQAQTQLPAIVNPLTFDAILLGCRFDLIYKSRLYVTGCDQGKGGDVWFLSRELTPVEDWFSPSVVWEEPDVFSIRSENPERISNFTTTHDAQGNIHAVWIQSPIQGNGASIEYARWDGKQWSPAESVIPSAGGVPTRLLLTADPLKRLLLNWIDGYNGDLVFSWANIEKANLASEWVDIIGLPTPSPLVDDVDVVVDGSGRIVAAYVVPVNEERGIYIVQSTDNGKTWTQPVRAFDAVAAGWERIGSARLALSADGVLHLLFIKNTVRVGQPVGLFYSRSADGGATWSDPQILSEGEIHWADVVAYGDATVHILWQEYDGLIFANVSQVSQDSGLTWGKQNSITGVNQEPTPVALAASPRGLLHFIQIVGKPNSDAYNQKGLVLQDWKWDGSAWELDITKDLLLKGTEIQFSLSADLTSSGYLGVFIPVDYIDLDGKFQSQILTFTRFLEDAANAPLTQPAILPVSATDPANAPSLTIEFTPTPDFSVLYDDNVSASPLQKNLSGLILLVVGVAATIFLLVWRRPTKQ
ncbi:MAG: exo-alpha-sialidase [Chloroflexota bacterium]|jgi:hypothetical protein